MNEYKTYICEYNFEGSKWTVEIQAKSHEEAEARLRNVGYGQVLGEVKLQIQIPVNPFRQLLRFFK